MKTLLQTLAFVAVVANIAAVPAVAAKQHSPVVTGLAVVENNTEFTITIRYRLAATTVTTKVRPGEKRKIVVVVDQPEWEIIIDCTSYFNDEPKHGMTVNVTQVKIVDYEHYDVSVYPTVRTFADQLGEALGMELEQLDNGDVLVVDEGNGIGSRYLDNGDVITDAVTKPYVAPYVNSGENDKEQLMELKVRIAGRDAEATFELFHDRIYLTK